MVTFLLRFARKLRRPYLFGITLGLFVLNLLVPDPLPFIDEILLGLTALVLGSLKKKPEQLEREGGAPPDANNPR